MEFARGVAAPGRRPGGRRSSLLQVAMLVLTAAVVAAQAASGTESAPESCVHRELNVPGECRRYADCRNATREYLQTGKLPSHFCRPGVVCCPSDASHVPCELNGQDSELDVLPCVAPVADHSSSMCFARTISTDPQFACFLQPPPPAEPAGSISQRKCVEYQKLSNVLPTSGPLVPIPQACVSVCKRSSALIVGGVDAEEGEFPHMAQLLREADRPYCGGTLISEKFVLTAAHCLLGGETVYPAKVRLGEHDVSQTSGAEKEVAVGKHFVHPDWIRSDNKHSDIMLLRLACSVRLSHRLRPACLFAGNDADAALGDLIVTGWGTTNPVGLAEAARQNARIGDAGAEVLKKALLSVASRPECEAAYRSKDYQVELRPTEICGTSPKVGGRGRNNTDSCYGDSGGPLQRVRNDTELSSCTFEVVGIVAKGIGCSSLPGIYTSVTKFVPWIESIVWPSG